MMTMVLVWLCCCCCSLSFVVIKLLLLLKNEKMTTIIYVVVGVLMMGDGRVCAFRVGLENIVKRGYRALVFSCVVGYFALSLRWW